MNKDTGDPASETRDTKIIGADSNDANFDTRALNVNDPAARTIEMSGPGPSERIVGARSEPGMDDTAGGYRIVRKIGEGGMGIVYEAEQQRPRRLVALKVIRGGQYAGEYHVKMFEREIQALARLKHPGIVSIYEAGRFDDGQVFFAMELLQGRSLLEFFEWKESGDGKPLSTEDRLTLFSRICEVVSYAHQRGVIHRDLKPQNIFVTDQLPINSLSGATLDKAAVKILDFGLARITDPDNAGATDVSQIGHVKGTLNYMSPEQLTGNPADVDVRSDIYALGVILYELLSGRLPYDIKKVSVPEAMRIISQQPPEPLRRGATASIREGFSGVSRVDADVDTIVMKALEKEPDRRYQSVAAMLDDVGRYLNNQPILARPPSAFYQLRKLVSRHRTASASLAAIVLLLLAFGIAMAAQSARIARERDRALFAESVALEERAQADLARQNEQEQRLRAEQSLSSAEEQQKAAEREKAAAEEARKSEQEQRLLAEQNLTTAREERSRAERQTLLAEKQEQIARDQKTLAEKRQAEAEEQKALVEQREEANRRLSYISQMNLAEQAWDIADHEQVQRLLTSQIPPPGKKDLRGFEWYYLWNLSNRHLWKIDQALTAVHFSPKGGTLAVNSIRIDGDKKSKRVLILDEETGRQISFFDDRQLIGYMPDGKLLTTPEKPLDLEAIMKAGAQIDPASLAELATEKDENRLRQIADKINQALTGEKSSRTVPEILDPASGEVRPTVLVLPRSPAVTLTLSPDGKHVLRKADDGLEMWEIESGRKVLSFLDEKGRTYWSSHSFSNDGRMIALVHTRFGGGKHRVTVFDTQTRHEAAWFESDIGFQSMAFVTVENMRNLVLLGYDGSTTRFDLATGRTDSRPGRRTEDKYGSGMPEHYMFEPKNWTEAIVRGRAVFIRNGCREEIIKGHNGFISSAAFSSDGRKLATVSADATLKVWDMSCDPDQPQLGHDPDLSADAKQLATKRPDSITVWDLGRMRPMMTVGKRRALDRHGNEIEKTYLGGPKLSPDGKFLGFIRYTNRATSAEPFSDYDSVIELWDLTRNEMLREFEEGAARFTFSPDGKYIAAVNRNKSSMVGDYTVNLWDAAARQRLAELGKGSSVTFTPDGQRLAVADDNKVRVIDIATRKTVGSYFKVHMLSPNPVSFSPDGKLAATTVDNEVRIWDVAGGHEVGVVKGHSGHVSSAVFSPDGTRLVSTSWEDNSIKIWDTSTWQKLMSFSLNNAQSVMFTPDGRALIVAGSRGTEIWRAPMDTNTTKREK